MKRTWIPALAIVLVSVMPGCSHNAARQADITAINAVETKLKSLTSMDVANANLAITAYTKFSGEFPNDTLAPVFLFKAASMAMSSGQYQRALSFYDNINTKYPDFKQIPDCIFVQGFIYDTYLKDTAKAHAKYLEVMNKYPNNNLAPQAKAAINALGKSTEELMKEFEEKNKGKDTVQH